MPLRDRTFRDRTLRKNLRNVLPIAAKFLVIVATLTQVSTARAQVSIYVAYTSIGFDFKSGPCVAAGDLCGEGGFEPALPNNTFSNGATLGSSYNFPTRSRFKLGVDLRDSYTGNPSSSYTGDNHGGNVFTASGKFSLVPHQNRSRPYIEVGVGYLNAHTDSDLPCFCFGPSPKGPPNFSASGAFFAVTGGFDFRLSDFVDLRLLEIGYSPAPANPSGTATVVSPTTRIGIGLVFNLPYPRPKANPSP